MTTDVALEAVITPADIKLPRSLASDGAVLGVTLGSSIGAVVRSGAVRNLYTHVCCWWRVRIPNH